MMTAKSLDAMTRAKPPNHTETVMRAFAAPSLQALAAVLVLAGPATAQTQTRLYDHVHMSVPDPQVAAQWYHDHIGGEWVDGRTDRLLFGTTRIMFLGNRGSGPEAE